VEQGADIGAVEVRRGECPYRDSIPECPAYTVISMTQP